MNGEPHREPFALRVLRKRLGLSYDETIRIGLIAPGVWKRRKRLNELLGPRVDFCWAHTTRKGTLHALGAWGLKGSAKEYAERWGLPRLVLEDAFISHLGTGNEPYGLLGIIADIDGVYYDRSAPTLMEKAIAQATVTADARNLVAEMQRHHVGKFNSLCPNDLQASAPANLSAIVVDQIAGDLSIKGASASACDFTKMLESACDEHGASNVGVKLHPYDGYGGRIGHLRALAERYKLALLPHRTPWIRCAMAAEHIYVVSSTAGLEALVAGRKVSCFGNPIFSGWGQTDDRHARRVQRTNRSLGELVQACYFDMGGYWSPALRRISDPLALSRFISANQRHVRNFGKGLTVYGIPKLKRQHISPFVSSVGGKLAIKPTIEEPTKQNTSAVWASRFDRSANTTNPKHFNFRVEDGFLRSQGLGADLVRPSSLVFDQRGIYYDPHQVSDLEHLLENYDLSSDEIDRADLLLEQLKQGRLSKYNQNGGSSVELPDNAVLVIGQVADDASILKASEDISSNRALLQAVRTMRPAHFLAYKPHPDVELAGRQGAVKETPIVDRVLRDIHPIAAIEACDELHTISSLMGFEALARGKKVVTHGRPFYAGWGLTHDRCNFPRRTRQRNLSELIYLTLIAYPYYVSPRTNIPCAVEEVVEALINGKAPSSLIPGAREILRTWRKVKVFRNYFS